MKAIVKNKARYLAFLLSVGIASVAYQAHGKQNKTSQILQASDVTCGYGACKYCRNGCDCANWQGKVDSKDSDQYPLKGPIFRTFFELGIAFLRSEGVKSCAALACLLVCFSRRAAVAIRLMCSTCCAAV